MAGWQFLPLLLRTLVDVSVDKIARALGADPPPPVAAPPMPPLLDRVEERMSKHANLILFVCGAIVPALTAFIALVIALVE